MSPKTSLLLWRASDQLEQEQVAAGKGAAFQTRKAFLGGEGARTNVSYEEAARALKVGVSAVKTLIHRLRQRHAQLVRAEVENPNDVDAELRSLREALVAAEGRVQT